ncbi:MAG: hypothetical protein KGL53_12865, partial [Elusimicrobia bacterium]|nr:hypothetical protein [Elusimicrobiota bacterium]
MPRQGVAPASAALVAASVAYLSSPEARAAVARDPYWPKWDAPWWHMTLLWELGLADAIPAPIVSALLDAMSAKLLDFFPLTDAEIPPGKTEHRHVLCHCA